jgi:hypothetical protein
MLAKCIFVLVNGKPGSAYNGLRGLTFVKGLVSSAPLKCKQRLGLQGQIFFFCGTQRDMLEIHCINTFCTNLYSCSVIIVIYC